MALQMIINLRVCRSKALGSQRKAHSRFPRQGAVSVAESARGQGPIRAGQMACDCSLLSFAGEHNLSYAIALAGRKYSVRKSTDFAQPDASAGVTRSLILFAISQQSR